jgi:hypothetical protein
LVNNLKTPVSGSGWSEQYAPLYILFLQEADATNGTVQMYTGSTWQQSSQYQTLVDKLSPEYYSVVAPYTQAGVGGGDQYCSDRQISRKNQIFARGQGWVKPIWWGAYYPPDLMNENDRKDYLKALGCGPGKVYPWAMVKLSGNSYRNRFMVASSIHGSVADHYKGKNESNEWKTRFNSMVMWFHARRMLAIAGQVTTVLDPDANIFINISGLPTVIGGDFNNYYSTTNVSGATVKASPKMLVETYNFVDIGYKSSNCRQTDVIPPTCSPKWGGKNSKNIIDYIFANNATGIGKVYANSRGTDWPSDHPMLLTEMIING